MRIETLKADGPVHVNSSGENIELAVGDKPVDGQRAATLSIGSRRSGRGSGVPPRSVLTCPRSCSTRSSACTSIDDGRVVIVASECTNMRMEG